MRKFFILLCAMLLTAQFAASQKNLYVVTKTGELYVYPAEKVSFGASLQDVPSDKDSLQDVPSDKDSLQDVPSDKDSLQDVPSDKDSLQDNTKIINGHKFIDLGLPSGLLWAETNIGAETAADDGNYYAWGETSTKDTYDHSDYKYYDNSSGYYTKYKPSGGKTVLENSDDAACVNWGSPCRMPTGAEFDELCDTTNCKWTWTSKTNSSNDTINGYEVKSKKNGNSVFLPASGYIYKGNLTIQYGHYWSSTLDSGWSFYAYDLCFDSSFHSQLWGYRYYGQTVRPVAEP